MIKSEVMSMLGARVELEGNKESFEQEFKAIANFFIEKDIFTQSQLVQFVKDSEDMFDGTVDWNNKEEIKKMFRESLDEIVSAIFDDSEEE